MNGVIAAIATVAIALSLLTGPFAPAQGASSSLGMGIGSLFPSGCTASVHDSSAEESQATEKPPFSLDQVPPYAGEPSVTINGNEPFFTEGDLGRESFQDYSELDRLRRCGVAFALVGPETLPTTKRESIGMVRPSGWQIARYSWVDGEYLFNRCHLIAYMLTGQNANERNLITGTRSLNVDGMLPLELLVSSYVHHTGNHVLYRVTPLFEGRNLVASGVLMEAESIEDGGDDVRFCVWCYNVEPGVEIDYATGENHADGTMP